MEVEVLAAGRQRDTGGATEAHAPFTEVGQCPEPLAVKHRISSSLRHLANPRSLLAFAPWNSSLIEPSRPSRMPPCSLHALDVPDSGPDVCDDALSRRFKSVRLMSQQSTDLGIAGQEVSRSRNRNGAKRRWLRRVRLDAPVLSDEATKGRMPNSAFAIRYSTFSILPAAVAAFRS